MNAIDLRGIRTVTGIVLCLGVFIWVVLPKRGSLTTGDQREKLSRAVKGIPAGASFYVKTEAFLKANGIAYMTQGRCDPVLYLLFRLLTGGVVGVLFCQIMNGWLFVPGCITGYFLVRMIVRLSNQRDNRAMMEDIKTLYDTLRIQSKAGVFLTPALAECYLMVKNRRLKQALLELTNQITAQKDVEEAVEGFRSKFDNGFLEDFCLVVRQSLSSGQTVQMLNDMGEQLAGLQHAITLKEEEALKRKLMLLQVAYYIGMLSILLLVFIQTLMQELAGL